ncbi:MAG TPA: DUF1572 family protein [Candidatus Angelobacter sp.]|nr:DUF1572 family protein [Candidatus Angelobacter sp.]
MAEENAVAVAYLDEVRRNFRGYKRLAEGALAQLQDADLFYAPDAESNSIAVIMKHISGNLRSRWTDFLTTDGEKPDRNRDQEFEMKTGVTRDELMRWWEEGWNCVQQTLAALQPAEIERTVFIRGEPHSVIQATQRSLAHIAYHVGQIIYLGKHIRQAAWNSLSIPKGKSAEYNARKPEDRKAKAPTRG